MSSSLRSAMVLVTLMALTLMVAGCAPAAAPDDPEAGGEEDSPTATATVASSTRQLPTATPASSTRQLPTATPTTASAKKLPTPTSASTSVSQTPLGDCWDGALPEGSIHCYVFEQSQMEGEIEVVAIYEAPNDVLHIFLARTEPLDDALTVLFRQKMTALLGEGEESGSLEFDLEFDWGGYTEGTLRGRLVPPAMKGYGQAFLHVGGLKAVQTQPGWASWTRLWPEESGASGSVRRDPGSGSAFDVSGIDTGNIPDPDCDAIGTGSACRMWKRDPESGVTGGRADPTSEYQLSYIQIKETLLPSGENEREALKRRLFPGYDESPFFVDEIKLIPVKYDYWELWTWATILNRFALSSANTIGIVWADVDTNLPRASDEIFPLHGLRLGSHQDASTVRETVGVGVLEAQMVIEALPELLPLLGIPVDAVGVVRVIEEEYIEIVPE